MPLTGGSRMSATWAWDQLPVSQSERERAREREREGVPTSVLGWPKRVNGGRASGARDGGAR